MESHTVWPFVSAFSHGAPCAQVHPHRSGCQGSPPLRVDDGHTVFIHSFLTDIWVALPPPLALKNHATIQMAFFFLFLGRQQPTKPKLGGVAWCQPSGFYLSLFCLSFPEFSTSFSCSEHPGCWVSFQSSPFCWVNPV